MSRPPLFGRRVFGRAARDANWCEPGCSCKRCTPRSPSDALARLRRRIEIAIVALAALNALLLGAWTVAAIAWGPR